MASTSKSLDSNSARANWRTNRRFHYTVKMTYVYLLLAVGAFFVSVPFLWMLSTSLKTLGQTFIFPPIWVPVPVQFSNYPKVFDVLPFLRYFVNTVFITGLSVAGILFASSLGGFSFARLRWRGSSILFVIVLSTMMLPPQVTMIPRFILFRNLEWLDSYKPLIVPSLFGTGFQIFLFRQFFSAIPKEIDEAAHMDGCGFIRTYWRIILPLSGPAIITGFLFSFRYHWNDFLEPLIYINSHDKFTLALGLRLFQGEFSTNWPLLMAASTITMLPVLLTFYFGQRYFIQGIVVSGVKG